VVHYEKLTGTDSSKQWASLFNYLELSFDESYLVSIPSDTVKGSMGDKEGVNKYSSISSEPISKWVKTFANPLRKRWAKNYLKWIGDERLENLGYSYDDLLRQLNKNWSLNYFFRDIFKMSYGFLFRFLNVGAIKHNIRSLRMRHKIKQYY